MLLSAPSLVTLVFALFAHSSVARLVEGPSGIEYSKRVGDVTPSSSPEPTYCLAFECPDSLRYSAPDVRLGTTEENDNIVCTYSVLAGDGPCVYNSSNGQYVESGSGSNCKSWGSPYTAVCSTKRALSRLEKKVQARQYKFKRSI